MIDGLIGVEKVGKEVELVSFVCWWGWGGIMHCTLESRVGVELWEGVGDAKRGREGGGRKEGGRKEGGKGNKWGVKGWV